MLSTEINVIPRASPRIRKGKYGVYYENWYYQYLKEIKTELTNLAFKVTEIPLDVEIHFYKNCHNKSKRYGDIDNLAKGILDACNGVLWKDDKQIVRLTVEKHFSEKEYMTLKLKEV